MSALAYWLKGSEPGKHAKDDWPFDARIFLRPSDIVLEISTHPPSIERDIRRVSNAILAQTDIDILDGDSEPVNFW